MTVRWRSPMQNIGIATEIALAFAEHLISEKPDLSITEVALAIGDQKDAMRDDLQRRRCGEDEIDLIMCIMMDKFYNRWADLRLEAARQRDQLAAEALDEHPH